MPMLIGYLSISASAQEAGLSCQISNEQMIRDTLYSMESTIHSTENLVEELELGNGLFCKVYEIDVAVVNSSGTQSAVHDFSLYYGDTYFGTLRQTTSWSYDGVNRPTLDSYSSVFYSTDVDNNYLKGVSSTTTAYGTSVRAYNCKADVYYNKSYIGTTT